MPPDGFHPWSVPLLAQKHVRVKLSTSKNDAKT
jgi:hypothetical protein